jgi:iron-sulfur cluster assembly protein
MVTITERAAARVLELLASETEAGLVSLRVAVEGGGCSGFRYALAFDGPGETGDEVSEQHGVRLLVDAESRPFLEGAAVDFEDGLNGAGFRVTNPNATGGCGCGSSFRAQHP